MVVGAVRPQDIQPLAAAADAYLEPLPDQQPAAKQHFQAIQRMDAVEEIAPTSLRPAWSACLVRRPARNSCCLSGSALKRKPADLVKGATQAFEQFTHAAEREPSPEGFLDPLTGLGRRLEASGGDLAFEMVELRRLQSARVALVLQGTKGLRVRRVGRVPASCGRYVGRRRAVRRPVREVCPWSNHSKAERRLWMRTSFSLRRSFSIFLRNKVSRVKPAVA